MGDKVSNHNSINFSVLEIQLMIIGSVGFVLMCLVGLRLLCRCVKQHMTRNLEEDGPLIRPKIGGQLATVHAYKNHEF